MSTGKEVVVSLKDQIAKKVRDQFVELTDSKTFDTELSFALQHIGKNPQLKKATVRSNIVAVLNIAQTGLSLNPVLKLAYLVPRSVNIGGQWVVETCLEPSYMGLCKLVTDSGSAKSIVSHLVHDGDEFEVSLGTETGLIHKPKYKSKDITHVYCVSVLSDGSKMVEVMTIEDINDIREKSESYKAFVAGKMKSCVWDSHFGEMARKTVIRRAIKYLPKTDMWNKLGAAVSLDESDYKASDGQADYIESLLMTAAIDHDECDSIFRELPSMTSERGRELIEYLNANQLDPISSGRNYSQTNISNKLNNEINE